MWVSAIHEWPLSYCVVTVAGNPEVAHRQVRHGAIIQRRDVKLWLDRTAPETDLLVTPPARTFIVEEVGARPVQTALAF